MRSLRTSAWHGDTVTPLQFPADWDQVEHWPESFPPLSDDAIRSALERPVGQAPIRELCRGRSRPVIIVDDLCRPTPVWRVMPQVLEQFHQAGIPAEQVTILMGTGSHRATASGWIEKKVGREVAARCRCIMHDATGRGVKLGVTSFGTPVVVHPAVRDADFLLGIGGVYPSANTGYGGSSKLALSVLTLGAIACLHNRHKDAGWGVDGSASSFRADLDEACRLLGLHTMITLQVNEHRDAFRVRCGDHFQYYPAEVAFARQVFAAPPPGDADVVICNAYPNDLSLTFARYKGTAAFELARPGASKVLIATCPEGVGIHGLFPVTNAPRFHAERILLRRMAAMSFGQAAAAVARRAGAVLRRRSRSRAPRGADGPRHPIWLYRPGQHASALPGMPGVRVSASWTQVVEAVAAEQAGRANVKSVLYPCAALQHLRADAVPADNEAREGRPGAASAGGGAAAG